jgi:hypothetical protein
MQFAQRCRPPDDLCRPANLVLHDHAAPFLGTPEG